MKFSGGIQDESEKIYSNVLKKLENLDLRYRKLGGEIDIFIPSKETFIYLNKEESILFEQLIKSKKIKEIIKEMQKRERIKEIDAKKKLISFSKDILNSIK